MLDKTEYLAAFLLSKISIDLILKLETQQDTARVYTYMVYRA
jgi:hypothetical protein